MLQVNLGTLVTASLAHTRFEKATERATDTVGFNSCAQVLHISVLPFNLSDTSNNLGAMFVILIQRSF